MTTKGTAVAMRSLAEKDRPTISVTTDGSDAALHAAELAVGLAGLIGAKLHVLNVLDEDRAFAPGSTTAKLSGTSRSQARGRPTRLRRWRWVQTWSMKRR